MRVTDRYMLREFLLPLVGCLLFFMIFSCIADMFGRLDEILKQQVTLSTLAVYYLSFLPIVFVKSAPFATLISTLYIVATLAKHNELIAMKAGGLSGWRIARPFLLAALGMSVVVLIVNEATVPWATQFATHLKEDVIKGKAARRGSSGIVDDITLYGNDHRMIYAKHFDPARHTLQYVIILEQSPDRIILRKVDAQEAVWQDQHWVFTGCLVATVDPVTHALGDPVAVPRLIIPLPERPADFLRPDAQPDFMNARQLRGHIKRLEGVGRDAVRRLLVDFNVKFAFPFMSLVLALLGLPLALKIRPGRALLETGITLVVSLCYVLTLSVSAALGKGGALPPLLAAWLPNLLFGGVGVVLMAKDP